jgi:hypothetical protein
LSRTASGAAGPIPAFDALDRRLDQKGIMDGMDAYTQQALGIAATYGEPSPKSVVRVMIVSIESRPTMTRNDPRAPVIFAYHSGFDDGRPVA